MQTRNKILVTGSALVVAASILFYSFNVNGSKKTVWVNLSKVYNEFGLKKDLEQKFKAVQLARKNILDSLELNLQLLANQLQNLKDKREERAYEFQLKKQEYLVKKQQMEEDNSTLQSEYNEQVLTQINQYVKEYGIMKDHSLILGADGSGVVMYAKDNIEVTDEVLGFINNKYKGVN